MFFGFRRSLAPKSRQEVRDFLAHLNVFPGPLMLGSGVLLLGVDLIVLLLRALGMSKGDALYTGLLVLGGIGWIGFKRFAMKLPADARQQKSDE